MQAATHRRQRPRCQICEAELPWHRSLVINSHRVFCSAHARQYRTRQRPGVSTEELETCWSDTLDNWRERPRLLDQECGTRGGGPSNHLDFYQRVQGWVLFLRRYGYWAWQKRSDFRGCDILACNPQTGTVRRFVSVGLEEVLEDLQGGRPAPHQAELGPYWGRRLPPRFYERLARPYLDEHHRMQLAGLVQVAPFPLYALQGQPLGLTLCSLGVESAGFQLCSVSFSFSSARYPLVRETVRIHSTKPRDPDRVVSHPSSAPLLARYGLSATEGSQAGDPAIQPIARTIEQVPLTGECCFWAQPYPLSWFHLSSEQTRLVGSTLGPSQEEVLHLLEALVVLNQRDESPRRVPT